MDEVWERVEPQSPCKKICAIHPDSGLCVGCLRTREEIASWSRLTSEGRLAILAELPDRQGRLARRRGGRAARVGG
jgi:hypothetical protein